MERAVGGGSEKEMQEREVRCAESRRGRYIKRAKMRTEHRMIMNTKRMREINVIKPVLKRWD